MNYLNDDFGTPKSSVKAMRDFFLSEDRPPTPVSHQDKERKQLPSENRDAYGKTGLLGTIFWNTLVLCERTAIDYSRNLLAYGIRIGMYAGVLVPSLKPSSGRSHGLVLSYRDGLYVSVSPGAATSYRH